MDEDFPVRRVHVSKPAHAIDEFGKHIHGLRDERVELLLCERFQKLLHGLFFESEILLFLFFVVSFIATVRFGLVCSF